MKIDIVPLEKISIDEKEIFLGMNKQQVSDLLGEPESIHLQYGGKTWRHYYYNTELAIDYNKDDMIEFIEFLGGIDGELKPYIYGISAFESSADELFSVLSEHNNGKIDDHEQPYSYAFLDISVGIYRESSPEAVQEWIDEMQANGEEYDPDALAEEMREANHWLTIGIGSKNYY